MAARHEPFVALTEGPLDLEHVRAHTASTECGATLDFIGTTRDSFAGRAVVSLAYEAFHEMALAEMRAIGLEIIDRWPGTRFAMVHRLGQVALGEISVVISVATPHRAACYEASRAAIEALKARVPIWKKEIYADGSAWKANAPG